MKKWIRIAIGFWAIVLIAVYGGVSQGVPVKSLENGNAFLYLRDASMHGGYYDYRTYTVTVLFDTIINGRTFHRLSDGETEYSDSSQWVVYSKGSEYVYCDFRWEIGDTPTLYDYPMTINEKGITDFLSDQQPYIAVTWASSTNRKFIKRFGQTYATWDGGVGHWLVKLLGARINGVVYGSAPTTDVVAEGPSVYALDQNYPNPFNPSTTIRYALPQRSHVTLTVFNCLGQHVAILVQGEQEAGNHRIEFDGRGLASGVYLYRIQVGPYSESKKLILVR